LLAFLQRSSVESFFTPCVSAPKAAAKAAFPKAIPDQLRVLREVLAECSYTTESLAELFKRKPVKSVEEGLQSLVAVGVAEYETLNGIWHLV
jgi:hypothetical protein|tara:strand:+ start:89 stop:364 length:276 start_codon:yes stop_codon:yes gene_type:complete